MPQVFLQTRASSHERVQRASIAIVPEVWHMLSTELRCCAVQPIVGAGAGSMCTCAVYNRLSLGTIGCLPCGTQTFHDTHDTTSVQQVPATISMDDRFKLQMPPHLPGRRC